MEDENRSCLFCYKEYSKIGKGCLEQAAEGLLGTGAREAARNRGERGCSEQLTEKALRAGKGEGSQGGRGCFGRKREKLFEGPVPDARRAFGAVRGRVSVSVPVPDAH